MRYLYMHTHLAWRVSVLWGRPKLPNLCGLAHFVNTFHESLFRCVTRAGARRSTLSLTGGHGCQCRSMTRFLLWAMRATASLVPVTLQEP